MLLLFLDSCEDESRLSELLLSLVIVWYLVILHIEIDIIPIITLTKQGEELNQFFLRNLNFVITNWLNNLTLFKLVL